MSHGHSALIPSRGVPRRKAGGLFRVMAAKRRVSHNVKWGRNPQSSTSFEPWSMVSLNVTSPQLKAEWMEWAQGQRRIGVQEPKESGWVPWRKGKGVPSRNPVSLSGRTGGQRRKPWCPPTEAEGSRDVSLGVLRRNNLLPTHYIYGTSKKSNTFQQIRQCSIQSTTYRAWFQGTYTMLLQL